jgi:uncharacterized protein YegP (UPF0339 family)
MGFEIQQDKAGERRFRVRASIGDRLAVTQEATSPRRTSSTRSSRSVGT